MQSRDYSSLLSEQVELVFNLQNNNAEDSIRILSVNRAMIIALVVNNKRLEIGRDSNDCYMLISSNMMINRIEHKLAHIKKNEQITRIDFCYASPFPLIRNRAELQAFIENKMYSLLEQSRGLDIKISFDESDFFQISFGNKRLFRDSIEKIEAAKIMIINSFKCGTSCRNCNHSVIQLNFSQVYESLLNYKLPQLARVTKVPDVPREEKLVVAANSFAVSPYQPKKRESQRGKKKKTSTLAVQANKSQAPEVLQETYEPIAKNAVTTTAMLAISVDQHPQASDREVLANKSESAVMEKNTPAGRERKEVSASVVAFGNQKTHEKPMSESGKTAVLQENIISKEFFRSIQERLMKRGRVNGDSSIACLKEKTGNDECLTAWRPLTHFFS